MKGLGTGMIIDSEGRILTENHVVAGATTIKVLLSNGDEYPAKVVGTGPKTDLAVIQINAGKQLDDWCQFRTTLGPPCARASHSGAVVAASGCARVAHIARTYSPGDFVCLHFCATSRWNNGILFCISPSPPSWH